MRASIEFFHRARLILATILIAMFSAISLGCARKQPLDNVVKSPSELGLLMWKARVADDFTLQEWRDFDEAVQQVKYSIMTEGVASGSEGVRDLTLQRINGKTVREILMAGFTVKLVRLAKERDDLVGYLSRNQRLRTRDGDDESAEFLVDLRRQQTRRLETVNEQIEASESVLHRRGLPDPLVSNHSAEPTPSGVH